MLEAKLVAVDVVAFGFGTQQVQNELQLFWADLLVREHELPVVLLCMGPAQVLCVVEMSVQHEVGELLSIVLELLFLRLFAWKVFLRLRMALAS